MSSVLNHEELRTGPGSVQGKCRRGRADHVVTTLNDRAGNVPNCCHIPENLVVAFEKSPVREVVVFKPGEGEGIIGRNRRRIIGRPH